jgi:cell wall-associated NlpC family hydrolase
MTEPLPGDFEVVTMGGIGGPLIHVAQTLSGTGSKNYEHARLYLGDGKIVEAQPGGARIADWNPQDMGLWSTGLIHLTEAERTAIVAAGHKYVGTPYSAADYFAIAAMRFHADLIAPPLRTYVASSKHMICSQLVDQCYQDGGVQLFDDDRWAGYVTPGELADLLLGLLGQVK